MSCYTAKVVAVTGAGSGIGRCLAELCAARGARLALSDINAEGLAGTVASLPEGTAVESHVVDMSSTLGLVGLPLQSAYSVAKFGVRGLTECLWSELEGTGLRAVCVFPGGIRTNLDKSARVLPARYPKVLA